MGRLVPEVEGYRRTPMEVVEPPGGLVQVVSYRDGSDPVVRLRPGATTWDAVTLRRTRPGSPALWKWWRATVDGTEQRRNVLLKLQDDRGGPVGAWTLSGCWPTRWRLVETTDERGNAIHVEEITLVVEDMDLA